MDPNLRIFVIPQAVPFHARPPTHTIIFLHGASDSARDFVDKLGFTPDEHGHSLAQSFPTVRWVFPEPVVGGEGQQQVKWFEEKMPEKENGDMPAGVNGTSSDIPDNSAEVSDLFKYAASIRSLIHREAFRLHGHYHRIGLMGHSQGAVTALQALLGLDIDMMPAFSGPRRLSFFLAFSARMPTPGRTLAEMRADLDTNGDSHGFDARNDEILRNTPVLLEHCDNDTIYPIADGRVLRDALVGFGADVKMIEYAGGGHWFNVPQGIEDAVGFLEETLEVQRKDPMSFRRRF